MCSRPCRRPPRRAPKFPLAALGPRLEAAAAAVAARTQTPVELCAHHLLTLAAMAAQRLVSLRLPTGQARPVSCWFATFLDPAEHRGAAEELTVGAVRTWEAAFDEKLAGGAALTDLVERLNLFHDPGGPEGHDRYGGHARMSGVFVRHPHDLVRKGLLRRVEAASLAALWDGKVITLAYGPTFHPRLSLHLVAAPRDGAAFLGDRDLADAGLLGRLLVARPASRIGTRVWVAADADGPPPELDRLLAELGDLYEQPETADSRVVAFSAEARDAWLAFAREVEAAMAEGGSYEPIRPLAAHLAEHAARLAAVIALVGDHALAELGAADLENGIALARFYAAESLRLSEFAPPALSDAEKADIMKGWLSHHAGEGITLRDVCRGAPIAVRDADTAYQLLRRLEITGIVTPRNDTCLGANVPRRARATYLWDVAPTSPGVGDVGDVG